MGHQAQRDQAGQVDRVDMDRLEQRAAMEGRADLADTGHREVKVDLVDMDHLEEPADPVDLDMTPRLKERGTTSPRLRAEWTSRFCLPDRSCHPESRPQTRSARRSRRSRLGRCRKSWRA